MVNASDQSGFSRHEQLAEQIRRRAAEYNVGLVDSLEQFQNYVRQAGRLADLMRQVNHPNQKGHALVATELLKWFPANN